MGVFSITEAIRILNAFAGYGGNTELLDRSKYKITHVDNDPERCDYLDNKFSNDKVYQVDAYEYIEKTHPRYDIIWASPPCKTHSRANWRSFYRDFRMYSLIDALIRKVKVPWIVENTVTQGIDMFPPVIVDRHYIWSNRQIRPKNEFPKDAKHPKGIQWGKKWRDRMNPHIGLYLFNELTRKQVSLDQTFTYSGG